MRKECFLDLLASIGIWVIDIAMWSLAVVVVLHFLGVLDA